jgi:hypothetical protein
MSRRVFLWLPRRLYSRARRRIVWRWLRPVLIYDDPNEGRVR